MLGGAKRSAARKGARSSEPTRGGASAPRKPPASNVATLEPALGKSLKGRTLALDGIKGPPSPKGKLGPETASRHRVSPRGKALADAAGSLRGKALADGGGGAGPSSPRASMTSSLREMKPHDESEAQLNDLKRSEMEALHERHACLQSEHASLRQAHSDLQAQHRDSQEEEDTVARQDERNSGYDEEPAEELWNEDEHSPYSEEEQTYGGGVAGGRSSPYGGEAAGYAEEVAEEEDYGEVGGEGPGWGGSEHEIEEDDLEYEPQGGYGAEPHGDYDAELYGAERYGAEEPMLSHAEMERLLEKLLVSQKRTEELEAENAKLTQQLLDATKVGPDGKLANAPDTLVIHVSPEMW